MSRESVLAERTIPSGYNKRVNLTMRVVGGLHYIKSNRKPYFTLTVDIHRKGFPNQCQSGGCDHTTILKYYPRFADLAALHLSDIDGVPMHGESNGWYDIAGCLPDGAGERYLAVNSPRHFPKPADKIDPAKPWDKTDYRNPTPDECLQIFADHVRTDIDIAREVRDRLTEVWKETREQCEVKPTYGEVHCGAILCRRSGCDIGGDTCLCSCVKCEQAKEAVSGLVWSKASWTGARAWFRQWIEEQKTRWKQEADACIARHGLKAFGDVWTDADTETGMHTETEVTAL